jgi:Concanavalin A-like lectin/glucanases superfamily
MGLSKSKQKKQQGGAGKGVAIDFIESLLGPNWQDLFFRYIVLTGVFVLVLVIILMIILYPGKALYNIQKYFFYIAIPLTLIFALLLNLNSSTTALTQFSKIVAIMVIAGIAIYYYSLSSGSDFVFSSYFNYMFLAVIIVIGLAILYQVIVSYMSHLTGIPGFIAQLIFYIPCILWDLWLYIFKEFQLTPYAIYAIILLEAILILLYVYMPNISNSVTGLTDGQQLLSGVYWLNKPQNIIATSSALKQIPTPSQVLSGQLGQYRYNYCISMWVYVNPQAPSAASYGKETEIFNYGFTDGSGVQHVKPMIRYYGGGNATDQPVERNKFVFYFATYPPTNQYDSSGDTFYDLTLPTQKWNQIVLNYNRNIVDLFINGSLERSFDTANNLPVFNPLDTITVGSKDGIDGAICNVAYYNHPLSSSQIAFSYNTLMNANPPVSRKPASTNIGTSPGTSITATK